MTCAESYPGYGWAHGTQAAPATGHWHWGSTLSVATQTLHTADSPRLQLGLIQSGHHHLTSHQSAPGLLTVHMGGVLSSIPLCSRAKELQDVPELDLRPEEKPESPVTVTQPQPVSQVNVNLIRVLSAERL